jgi:hypothetical protein
MDAELALEQVNEFLNLCDTSIVIQDGDLEYYGRGQWQQIDRAITQKLVVVEPIAQEIAPWLVPSLRENDMVIMHQKKRAAAVELQAHLQQADLVDRVMGPTGPRLAAAELHPWVWEEAAPRWDAGFYRDAVQAAATRIFDVELPRKLGVQPQPNPADLFSAFAPDRKTGTLLRFTDMDPTDAGWASVHRGTMLVGQGCVAAIRNPRTHRLAVREEQVVLEELATLSLLARWIDDAEAVPASTE